MPQTEPLQYPHEAHPELGSTIEVAPDVRWVRLPLPFVLDHVNLWLLTDAEGSLLVDTGIGLDSVKQAWSQLIPLIGASRPIRRILVTHCHPDHLGLAKWLSDDLGAEVLVTQGELLMAYAWWNQLPGHDLESMLAFFARHGLDDDRLDQLAAGGPAYRKRVPELPASYRRILDGEKLDIGGREWQVIVGHGHSPEHASLYCENIGVLISGDMVLPRITTNISVLAATPDADPLGLYLASLQRLKALPQDVLVLPSHGRPFRGLHARIGQLEAHHRERCRELLEACSQPKSAAELLPVLFRRKLDAHQVMFAMGEAIAHLNYLEHARRVRKEESGDGKLTYVVAH